MLFTLHMLAEQNRTEQNVSLSMKKHRYLLQAWHITIDKTNKSNQSIIFKTPHIISHTHTIPYYWLGEESTQMAPNNTNLPSSNNFTLPNSIKT